jgi:hypothetical protein
MLRLSYQINVNRIEFITISTTYKYIKRNLRSFLTGKIPCVLSKS